MFLFAMNGLSNNDLGLARGIIVFQELWPGAGFKTGDFVEERLGRGYRRTTHVLDNLRCAGVVAGP